MTHPADFMRFRCIILAYWHFKIHIKVLPSLQEVSSSFFFASSNEIELREGIYHHSYSDIILHISLSFILIQSILIETVNLAIHALQLG